MKLLTASLNPDAWVDLALSPHAAEGEKQTHRNQVDKLRRQLTDVLMAENLVVLTGLGTSLCVKKEDGQPEIPTMGKLWESAKAGAGDTFDALCETVFYDPPENKENIEHLLSRCQMWEKLNPDADGLIAKFVQKTERDIATKCRVPKQGQALIEHQLFLKKVARRSTRLPRLKLFTTNYDLCFEAAARNSRFVCVDGFSHTQPQEFDGGYFDYDLVRRRNDRDVPDYIANVFHLYKIHGSVNWKRAQNTIIKQEIVEDPVLIYPREGKFQASYEQPFFEMMSRFQMSLRQPNTGLLIVGFGFNDDHLSQPILTAIDSNVGLKTLVVSLDLEQKVSGDEVNTTVEHMAKLIKGGDMRLSLLLASFEELVKELPDLVADTESEQHDARLRASRGMK